MYSTDQLSTIIPGLPSQPMVKNCFRVISFTALTKSQPIMPLYVLGPGMNGQRYTPKNGPNALYVAEDLITAQAEYLEIHRAVLIEDPALQLNPDPTVQLTIQVCLERVLDLTKPIIQEALGTSTLELTGSWRRQMIKNITCPTQVLARVVYDSGYFQAMRYPSARSNEHANLIIWVEYLSEPSFVRVYDTRGVMTARIPPKLI